MPEVILIGTSHVAKQSVDAVKRTIEQENPDLVAVELDRQRFNALMSPQKPRFSFYNLRRVGLKGFLFALVGSYISKKIGRVVGVEPGSEMLTAVHAARKSNTRIALIDQDIHVTLSRFSRYFSWKERWHLVVDMFRGLVSPKKEIQRYGLGSIDLSKVPSQDIIEKLLVKTRDRYPNLYRVLVHERNIIMVKRIIGIMSKGDIEKLVVVVGAGHRKGMATLLEDQPKANFSLKLM